VSNFMRSSLAVARIIHYVSKKTFPMFLAITRENIVEFS